jgi:hypothetical protein
MSNSDKDEILSKESEKLIRADALKLAEMRDKLKEARAVAEQFHREPAAADYKESINKLIEEVDRTLSRRIYFRAVRDMPWPERLWDRLRTDKYLAFATFGALTLFLGLVWPDLFVDAPHFKQWMDWLRQLIIPHAHAQAGGGTGIDARSTLRFVILAVISFGFFFALGVMGFSSKPDARKFAADMIKTILGVYIGMATKLVD